MRITLRQRVRMVTRAVRVAFGGQKQTTPFTFPMWGNGEYGVPALEDYLTYADEGYAKNAVVHACIREISRSAPSARWRVMRRLPNAQSEIWEEHPLQGVLDAPNPHQSQIEFLELLYTYLNMDGNAFILREREGRRTARLWMPRPDKMRPVISEDELLGFVYVADSGERTPWLPEEVIHIKEPNPGDPYDGLGRGLPPLSAAAYEADVDNSATQFTKAFFDNAAVPFGLLKSKNILDDAEVKRIRARIKEQYVGSSNWWEMLILDADAEYQQLGLDLEKMAFVDLRAITETRICATFKVPPILVGIKAGLDASTYSNYTQARRAMWEDKIIPDNTKTTGKLTMALGDELGADGVIKSDYSEVVALQEDRNNRFSRANQGVTGGWVTVNEARREVGLGPVTGGDVFLRTLASTERETPGSEGDLAKGVVKEITAESAESAEKNGSNPLSDPPQSPRNGGREESPLAPLEKGGREELGAAVWKAMDLIARAWELRFVEAARDQLEGERRDLMALARTGDKSKKEIDWGQVAKVWFGYLDGTAGPAWVAAFRPLFEGLLNAQAEEWGQVLGITWSLENPEVRAFIQSYTFAFMDALMDTTKEALRSLLTQSQGEGWPITKVIDEVGALYEEWGWARAEMIARSETIRSSNAGAVEAYRQAGITKKEWFTAEDERVCPFCGEMHEKVISVTSNYFSFGDVMRVADAEGTVQELVMGYSDVGYPPLHPLCRCTVLPVVDVP